MSLKLETTFSNSQDIDAFFQQYNAQGFIDWFNTNMAGQNNFSKISPIKSNQNFTKLWNNIPTIYGQDTINIVEFISLTCIALNETGSTFFPSSEGINSTSNPSNPGTSYAFNAISGLKASYDTAAGNKNSYILFNDPDYISAHKHKPYGALLSNTTDTRWSGSTFPLGFDGAENISKEVSSQDSFITNADFFKFRGRGIIQTTLRSNYISIIKFIVSYTDTNSKILQYQTKWSQYGNNYDKIATVSTNADWDDLFQSSDLVIAAQAIYIHAHNSRNYYFINVDRNTAAIQKSVFNMGLRISGGQAYAQLFQARVFQLINTLDAQTPVSQPGQFSATASTPSTSSNQPPQQEGAPNDANNNVSNNGQTGDIPKVEGLTNFFRPTITVAPIVLPINDINAPKLNEISFSLGYLPFVWYNDVQIEPSSIVNFSLSSDGLLPSVKIVFYDTSDLISDVAFPMDDTIIKIFLNSKSKSLRSILMEFKITKMTKTGSLYTVQGLCNINGMYIKSFSSYNQKSSFEVLMQVAKDSGLGFNSNISATSDTMTWINPNLSGEDFIREVISKAYRHDDSFLWCYVDYYYNLNVIDVEEAFRQELKNVGAINGTGLENIKYLQLPNNETVGSIFLTSDKALRDSNLYFDNWKIINRATEISLKKGYLNKVKYYDILSKVFNIFDIDSITTDGLNTIILKAKPGDEDFFNKNVNSTYNGKQDIDNLHKNYSYAQVQNSQNIDDIQKVGILISLPKPNYNLFRFQKIYVLVSEQVNTPSADMINRRLTGEWLIINIKFRMDEAGTYTQMVSLVKRELELSDDEKAAAANTAQADNRADVGANSDANNPTQTINPSGAQLAQITNIGATQSAAQTTPHKFDVSDSFSDSHSINDYFTTYGFNGFIDFFNSTQANKGAFAKFISNLSDIGQINSTNGFNSLWNNIPLIYGKDSVNVIEFLTLNSIILQETNSTYTPIPEQQGDINNSGISYQFNSNAVTGKLSYNTNYGNKTCFELFNDSNYIAINGHKGLSSILANTTDIRWKSDTFPTGFSGGDLSIETSTSGSVNGFLYEADFNKFRSRGFIKSIGRDAYKLLVNFILNYTGTEQTILDYKATWQSFNGNLDLICTISLSSDWDTLFNQNDLIIVASGIAIQAQLNTIKNWQYIDVNRDNNKIQKSVNNAGLAVSYSNKTYGIAIQNRVYQIVNYLQKNTPNG